MYICIYMSTTILFVRCMCLRYILVCYYLHISFLHLITEQICQHGDI